MSFRKDPPPQFPLEKASTLRDIGSALDAAITTTPANEAELIDMIIRLGVPLLQGDWPAAERLRAEMLEALSDEARDYVVYACALAGMPGAAEHVASGFATVSRKLGAWMADELWKLPATQDDPAKNMRERLRVATGLSIGWSAVGGSEVFGRLFKGRPLEHAEYIASEIDAVLWSEIHLDGWKSGWNAGKHTAERAEDREKVEDPPRRERSSNAEEGVVVVASVAADTTSGGKEASASVKTIVGKRLPLVRATIERIADARAALVVEFPHAIGSVDALLGDIRPGDSIRFQPTVVVGEPGGGKSRLIRRVLDLLGVGWSVLDAATSSDMGIIGSPRRWASGYPSLPIITIERHGIANPALLVDEIEKAGRSTAGSIHDPLLSLLERSTAVKWRDQFLDAEVDVSHVSWLFTANSLAGIPGPLRNRLRILRMPRPGREHVPQIAARVLQELLRDRGIDERWEPPLDGEEIAAITQACGEEVSVRDIQRYVAGIIDARSREATRN
jgi:hypothetical protein